MYNNQNNSIMKKQTYFWSVLTFIVVAMLSFGFMSCGGKENDDPEPAPVNNKPTLSVEKTSITLDSSNSNSEVTVNVENTGWSVDVTKGSDWLYANKNGDKVSISAKENTNTEEREGTVKITATSDSNLSCSITVTQNRAKGYITVNGTNSAEHSFPGAFDNGKSGIDYKQAFKIKSNVIWTLSGKVEWLNVSATSGNGEVDLSIYPTSENPTSNPRTADLILSGNGAQSVTISITQLSDIPIVKVTPTNLVALYNQIGWELETKGDVNKFQYLIAAEAVVDYKTDKELLDDLTSVEAVKFKNGYLFSYPEDSYGNTIKQNTSYYICTVAYDEKDKRGEMVKTKIKTPQYYDVNNDAYVSFDNNLTYNLTGGFFQFTAHKEGYCNTYHVIFGNLPSDYYRNKVLFAFEINYYLKYNKKHWFASTWDLEIITDYPNDHLFTHYTETLSKNPLISVFGWGVFKDGKISSDMTGFQADISDNKVRKRSFSLRDETTLENLIIDRSVEENRAKYFK